MEFIRTDAGAVSQKDISRRNTGISMKYHLSPRVMSIFLATLLLVSPCSRIYIGFFAPLSANDIKTSRQGLQNVISRRASMTEGNRFRLCSEQHHTSSLPSLSHTKRDKNKRATFRREWCISSLTFYSFRLCVGGSFAREKKDEARKLQLNEL